MRQRLNRLVLITAVVSALGAFGASGATAVTGHFIAEKYPAELIGEQGTTNVFKDANGFEVTCVQVFFRGTLEAKSEVVTLAPEYLQCHAIVTAMTFPVTITDNGCTYELNGTTKHMDLICPGEKMQMHVYASAAKHSSNEPFCQYTFGEQKTLKSLDYENKGTGSTKDIGITVNLGSVAYVRHGLTACPSHSSAGTYSGTATLQAFSGGNQVGLHVG